MTEPLDLQGDADDVATAWFARRRSGAMTADEAARLEAWLAADPAHRAAFDATELTWKAADALRSEPGVLALREAALQARPDRRRLAFAIAASLAIALVGSGVLLASGALPFRQMHDQEFRTGVGQQATVKLPDGSVVTLNTDTVLRTRAAKGRRLLYLDKGQAYFRVAKDPSRPFIVAAGGRTVTAVGTAFDVMVGPKAFKVTLVEGKVRVEAPVEKTKAVQVTELTPGSQLAAADDKHWTLASTDVAKETGWLRGQLIFERERLGDVAAELNRYSTKKIVVLDEKAAETPVTAAFKPGDVDGFVRAVRDYGFVRVVADGEDSVEIEAAS